MKGQFLSKALTPGIAIGALIFAGYSTTETRISGHPEIYQSLSSRDQALVSQGKFAMGCRQTQCIWSGAPRPQICERICAVARARLGLRALHDLLSVLLPLLWSRLWLGLRVRINESRFRGKASSSRWPQLRHLWQSVLRSILLFLHTVFRIHTRWSLSPVAGSSPSSTWYHRIPEQKFCRVLTKKASV